MIITNFYIPGKMSKTSLTHRSTPSVSASLFRSAVIASFLLISSLAHAQTSPSEAIESAKTISSAFSQVAEKITPSVVSISSFKKARNVPTGKGSPNLNDPFFDRFKDFFGDDFFERFGQEAPQQGLGTGVIVDARGYILTNNHVVGDADELEVRRVGGTKSIKAKVVGTDPKSDLAVIKIDGISDLKAASLGNSENLKIGDWVVAAGSPFGLDNTITAGIVSAKGRSLGNAGQYEDFIQTDAAINPGNSGGPLCNLAGEVIGINTAIFTRSGGYMGVGFAIPSNMAKTVMDSLISKGRVVRGWLGVGIQNLSEDLAASFAHAGTEGSLVGQVQEGSPAEKAGFKQGDIILEMNGVKVKDVNQLRNLVASTDPGQKIDVLVFRDGQKLTLSPKIEELPAQKEEAIKADEPQTNIGITVENITPELSSRLGTKKTKGVVVTGVVPGSVAERSGIAVRDIIVSVNSKPVSSVKEFRSQFTDAGLKKGLRIVVETGGMERFVFLQAKD